VFLGHDLCEHPVAVQLGGFDPKDVGGALCVCVSNCPFSFINQKEESDMAMDKSIPPPSAYPQSPTKPEAAAICEQYGGFNEINLNVGCPRRVNKYNE
jgi:hypothetical protein